MNDSNGTERTAQLEKALLRSLESLDRGDIDGARQELMRIAPATQPEPLAPSISDGELDAAFENAEPDQAHMIDADSVAQAAIAEADRALSSQGEAPLAHEVGDRFVTATMAELLEQQGDSGAASQIRATLIDPRAATEVAEPDTEIEERAALPDEKPRQAPRPSRDHVVRTLETWLQNLRGGARA